MCSCVGVGVERSIIPLIQGVRGTPQRQFQEIFLFLRENLVYFELPDGQDLYYYHACFYQTNIGTD